MQIRRVKERLSALGNIVACNDYVAIVHADIGNELETALKEVLKVEVFRMSLGTQVFVSLNKILQVYCYFRLALMHV